MILKIASDLPIYIRVARWLSSTIRFDRPVHPRGVCFPVDGEIIVPLCRQH